MWKRRVLLLLCWLPAMLWAPASSAGAGYWSMIEGSPLFHTACNNLKTPSAEVWFRCAYDESVLMIPSSGQFSPCGPIHQDIIDPIHVVVGTSEYRAKAAIKYNYLDIPGCTPNYPLEVSEISFTLTSQGQASL